MNVLVITHAARFHKLASAAAARTVHSQQARLGVRPDDARGSDSALGPDLRPLVDEVLVLDVGDEAVEVRGVRRRGEFAVGFEVGLDVRHARAEGGGLGDVDGDEAGDALAERELEMG